jgi:hypothetical protein
MKATDQLMVIVVTFLKPAMAAGMSEVEASIIYDSLMKRLVSLQERQPKFSEAFLKELQLAIIVARGNSRI